MEVIEFYSKRGLAFYKQKLKEGIPPFSALVKAETMLTDALNNEIKIAYIKAEQGIVDSKAFLIQTTNNKLYNRVSKMLKEIADVIEKEYEILKMEVIYAFYVEVFYYEMKKRG